MTQATDNPNASPRIALITGGSRGLGRSMALALADNGVHLVITYQKNTAAAEEVLAQVREKGVKALALPLDLQQSWGFAAFADTLRTHLTEHFEQPAFDFLVNNAGHGLNTPFTETTEAQFDALMQVHLRAPFFFTQALLPLMRDGGRILNVSSGLARFTLPGYAAYGMMKGGVEVLTRYLAQELGPRRISVNTLAPGAIATDFGGGVVRDVPEVNQAVAAHTALGRVGQPEDIGPIVAALLAPGTHWINGQRIEASGGQGL